MYRVEDLASHSTMRDCWSAYMSGRLTQARDLLLQMTGIPEWYRNHISNLMGSAEIDEGVKG